MPTKVIQLYQPIGELDFFSPDCMSATMFAEELRGAAGHDIELRISSPGGEVSHGFAMAALLRGHVGKKTAIIDGFCASAATFPALACDEVLMNELSMFMIHRSSGGARGHADDMEDVASVLNSLDALAAAEYERKSGQSKATVAGWMARNTWFTPTQALAAGLCSKVLTGRSPAAAKATAQTIKYYMRAGSLPDDVRAFMNPTAAALPQVRPVLPVPSTGAKKMKSTAITRGLFVALAGLSHYAALAAGSADPEEKALGEQLGALDVTAPTAQLTDVKAPELSSLLEVHDKVVAMVGSEDGLLGGLEAIEANAARKGAAAGADKMTQVNALLLAAVDPPRASRASSPRPWRPASARRSPRTPTSPWRTSKRSSAWPSR